MTYTPDHHVCGTEGPYSPVVDRLPRAPEAKRFKPYIVTIEVQAHTLDEARAIASIMSAGDGSENGEVQSVVQKYRMTNVGTEWYRK